MGMCWWIVDCYRFSFVETKGFRMDLEEIGINAGNWVDSAQDRDNWRVLVNAALNLRVP